MTYASEVLADNPLLYWRLNDAGIVRKTATSSTNFGSEPASNAIDGSAITHWTTNGVPSGWLRIELSGAAVATGYTIRRRDDIPNRNPKDWTFEGSNNGSTWTTLDTRAGVTWGTPGETKVYGFSNSTAYLYYRLNITANNGDAYLSVTELVITPNAVAADSSGSSRDGTFLGNVVLGATGALTGDSDKAVTLDGTTAYASIPYAAWMPVTAVTVSAWIKTTATGLHAIMCRDDTSQRVFQFRHNSGTLEFVTINGGAGVVTASQAASINDGNWHHVAATYDAVNIKLYKDGALINTTAAVGALSTQTAGITVGVNTNFGLNSFFNGTIDEAAYFGTALSAARILAQHTAGVTPPPPATPTGLSVTDETPVALTLNWSASTGSPTGYDVRIDGGAPVDVGNVLTHEFTGLTPSTAYTLEVRAYNAGGDSGWASIGGTTLDLDDPTGLAVDPAVTTLELSWDAVTGADAYEVRLDGGTPLNVGAALSYVFDELDPATTYTLEVRALAGASASGWASIEGTTLAHTPFGVWIKVGDHEFTISSDDTVDPEDPIHVLDGLNIAWAVDESDPWPAQPGPGDCQIGFYTGDVDNLEDVDINTPISIVLTDDDANVFGTFHGRVAQLDAQPIRRNAGLFTLYTVRGVGYVVDLDELPIVIGAEWPAESGDNRFARIVAAITAAGGPVVEPPADVDSAAFEAVGTGTTNAGALLRDHLRQVAIPGDFGPQRYLLVPVVIADELDHFECVLLERTVDAALLPGTLDVVDGLLTLAFPDPDADGLVDAGIVRLETPWTRLKYRAVNRVTVTGDTVTAEASRPGTPVRSTIATTLTDVPAAQRMAELYLPDPDETNGWVADTFRLEAWLKPSTITPAWFPDHREDPASTSVYVMPIAIVGIAPEINLAGNIAYAGQLTTVSLTLAERRIVVDFALRLQLPLGVGAEAASWEWLEDEHPTVAWEDADPDLSWYEARLARRP